MGTPAEEAARKKRKEDKRRLRRGPAPELSPEEEEDMYLPDGSRNPKYYREESDQPIAMDEFKDEAKASGGFSDEEPQRTFEEEAAEGAIGVEGPSGAQGPAGDASILEAQHGFPEGATQLLGQDGKPKSGARDWKTYDHPTYGRINIEPDGTWRTLDGKRIKPEEAEPMAPLGNQILSDTEAQVLANDAMPEVEAGLTPVADYDESKDLPYSVTPEIRKKVAEEADEIHQEVLSNTGQEMTPSSGGIVESVIQRDAPHVEKLEEQKEIVDRLGSGESRAEIAAANNPDLQAAIAAKADREAAKPDIHERDKATAAEMAARFEARGPGKNAAGVQYDRSAVEPPMINSEGKELGSKYYDPMLSEVKNIVVDGVIVGREVVDLEGVREEENARMKQKGMVWMIPSKGGFKTGDQRFAGEGPGHWARPDQALAADTTNIERPIEEARRQAVYDKKKRTPLEVREDNLRAKREHEENLKRIEFGKDDDLEDEAKIEMKIKRFTALLQQPGLTAEERRNYQQQLNSLLSGGEVGGAPAGDASDGPSVSDVSNDLALQDPELETDLDSMLDHYVGDDYGVTNPLNPYDWGQTFQGIFGGEINSSNEMGLGYLAGQLSGMFQQGRLKDDPAFLVNLKAKILQKMDPAVINRLDDPDEADLSAEEWQLVRDFFGPLLADPPTMPTNVDTISDENMGWGWIGQSGGWGN